MPFDILDSFGAFVNFFLGMVTGVVAFLGLVTFFTDPSVYRCPT